MLCCGEVRLCGKKECGCVAWDGMGIWTDGVGLGRNGLNGVVRMEGVDERWKKEMGKD